MTGSWFRRMFPPYYKYAVFLLAGFELVFSCLVLAISEEYYKSAALLLPVSYKMFDDTVMKRAPDFNWNNEAKNVLEMYKYKLMIVWVICTFCVLSCMLVVIPQFFDFNDRKGNPSQSLTSSYYSSCRSSIGSSLRTTMTKTLAENCWMLRHCRVGSAFWTVIGSRSTSLLSVVSHFTEITTRTEIRRLGMNGCQ